MSYSNSENQKIKEYNWNFHSIKSFSVDLSKLYQVYQVRDDEAKQVWLYIFDYVCLTKLKNQKDCFRKAAVKFYKNYFPEYKYFKDNYRNFIAFKNLPNKKNYLVRKKCLKKNQGKIQARFYEQNYQHDIETILLDRGQDDCKDHEMVFQFKNLIKNMLQITYDSFYNESLILTDHLTLEFCYQQLKYLEIEFFYCCISFKIKDQYQILERITCILRRFYHFWVELLFETYCFDKLKSSRSNKSEKSEEELYLEENKEISERLEKFKNNNGLCRKQQFFQQTYLPSEEKEQQKNETYEFSFGEFNQQDEFDDETIKKRYLKFDLKIDDILDYYPFAEKNFKNEIQIKQNFSKVSSNKITEHQSFLDHIEMLAKTNINILNEFIFAEYPNWQYYQGQYTIIIQLYRTLKETIKSKSILKGVVETYKCFKDSNNLNILYEHDRENNQFFMKQKFKKKLIDFKEEHEDGDDESYYENSRNDSDDNIDEYGERDDQIQSKDYHLRKKEKISKAVEKIINSILFNNCQKLVHIFRNYLKDENIQKIGHNIEKMYFIFQFDSIIFQKIQVDDRNKPIYEYNLDDALAFDLQLFICMEINKLISQETSISREGSLKNLKEEEKSDNKDDDEDDKKNNSIDLEEDFEEKENKAARQFYESCFQSKHQSKRYIRPIPYENLTYPPTLTSLIVLPEYNDSQKGSDQYFDDLSLKPKIEINQNSTKQKESSSVANEAVFNKFQQKKSIFQYKDEDLIYDINSIKNLAQNLSNNIISGYKGSQSKQADVDYNLQQYFDVFGVQKN